MPSYFHARGTHTQHSHICMCASDFQNTLSRRKIDAERDMNGFFQRRRYIYTQHILCSYHNTYMYIYVNSNKL